MSQSKIVTSHTQMIETAIYDNLGCRIGFFQTSKFHRNTFFKISKKVLVVVVAWYSRGLFQNAF